MAELIEKEITKRSTKKSLVHWKRNLKTFPSRGSVDKKRVWFDKHCSGNTCALCKVMFDVVGSCNVCPLNDYGVICCAEWYAAKTAKITGTLGKHHIRAVHDRIDKEYKAL